MSTSIHATTIFAVQHNGHSAMAGDGQVTLGEQVKIGRASCRERV